MRDRLMPAAGWFRLAAAATVSSLIAFSAYGGAGAVAVTDPSPAPKCRAGTRPVPLTWGDTVRWPRNTTRAIVPNLGGSAVDLDLTLIDPAQRNLDDSNPLADLGEANSAPGQPLAGWDPRPYTGTDGEFGPGFLTIGMNSLDAGDTVTFEFGFSRPVLLPDVSVGDLDFAGLGASPAEEPWSSFQDEVTLTAARAGAPVGATLTPAAGTRPPTGASSAGAIGAVGGPYQPGIDGDLAPDDPAGTLVTKIDEPVTRLALAYSNGPDDETAEAGAKAGPATEPGATPGGAQALGPNAAGTPHAGGTPHGGGTPHPDGTPHGGGTAHPDGTPHGGGRPHPDGTADVGGTPSAGGVPAWSRILPPPASSVSDSQTVRLNPFTICVGTASVGGRITADVDGNGARSAGEPGLPGVTVELADSDGRTAATRTTGADGEYAFDALPPFDWTVRVVPATLSPGAAPTTDPDGTLDDRTTIDVEPGQAVEHADFGYRPAGGTVAGTVFADRDDDGLLDPADGDGGIAGVSMALTGTDLAGNPVSLAAATGDDGAFAFRDVPAGTYLITESQPAGYDDGRDSAGGNATGTGDDSFTVTLPVGGSSHGNNLAELPTASLAGQVYVDADNDGSQNHDERGAPGVHVRLTGTDDAGHPLGLATTTGPDGGYLFDRLRPGDYTVTEAQPPNLLDGNDAAGSAGGAAGPVGTDAVAGIAVKLAQDATGYRFGELAPASLAGTVIEDNRDPIPHAGVTLTGTDDLGQPVDLHTSSDAAGAWAFTGLRPGSYDLTETQPPGFGDGPDTAGSAGGGGSGPDISATAYAGAAGPDTITGIRLGPGQSAFGYAFGETRSSLAGSVYVDADGDGARDAGERGLRGVPVSLAGVDDAGHRVRLATTTNVDGSFVFERLLSGAYTLTESQPAEYADGADTIGMASFKSAALLRPDSVRIALPPGTDATGLYFGELGATVDGIVWLDTDNDGSPESGEPTRLGGVRMTLVDGHGAELARTRTGKDGSYHFLGLAPGVYTVVQTQPDGYGTTTVNERRVTLAPGGAVSVDFGEQLGAAGDLVWHDTDADGVHDDGEPGASGVTVVLLDTGGREVRRTTTDAGGHYRFADLAAGAYRVRFQPSGGRAFTAPGRGTAVTGSDADLVSGTTAIFTITVAADGTITRHADLDAGLVPAMPDLAVDLMVDNQNPDVGDTVTYTRTVTNSGNTPVHGVGYRQTVPAGLAIQAVSGVGWSCRVSDQVVNCADPDVVLPGDVLPQLNVRTIVTRSGATLTSAATVFALDGQLELITNNNTDAAAVTIAAAPASQASMLPAVLSLIGLLLIAIGPTLRTIRRRPTD